MFTLSAKLPNSGSWRTDTRLTARPVSGGDLAGQFFRSADDSRGAGSSPNPCYDFGKEEVSVSQDFDCRILGPMRQLLSGNEAIARGAWEAGVEVAAAYPGTPSTEILENFAHYPDIYAEWSANEKVALDLAIGAAYAGKRAMAAMKHVGLNVASESLFYASYTGVNAGLVIITADDPGLHSSQNEQDNRHYARFAKVPMLEPSDSQEAKEMVGAALDLSEQFDTPVLLRTTTRTSHAKSIVEVGDRRPAAQRPYQKNPQKFVMIPGFAKRRHPVVEERLVNLAEYADACPLNRIEPGDPSLGIVSSGPSYQYAREVFPDASFLKLGMVWPLPKKLIAEFAAIGQAAGCCRGT